MRTGRTPSRKHTPRRSGVGARQVLIPGSRKQWPHPWRARLLAARQGKPTTKVAEEEVAA